MCGIIYRCRLGGIFSSSNICLISLRGLESLGETTGTSPLLL